MGHSRFWFKKLEALDEQGVKEDPFAVVDILGSSHRDTCAMFGARRIEKWCGGTFDFFLESKNTKIL